jgi:nicotinamidase-related amidase
MLVTLERSALVVVDIQPNFLAPIHRGPEVLQRAKFLVQAAGLLGVPIFASEQFPERMGGTEESLHALLKRFGATIEPKMRFSAGGCPGFWEWLEQNERDEVILVGIETHICVLQTGHELMQTGNVVYLAADAISARSEAMHTIGIERLRHLGAEVGHSESFVYEWMQSAEHPQFREVLKLVKTSG